MSHRLYSTGCRGSNVIEFAFALPVILILLTGTVNLGVLGREANVALEASRYAARLTAASYTTLQDPKQFAIDAALDYLEREGMKVPADAGSEWLVLVDDSSTITQDGKQFRAVHVTVRANDKRTDSTRHPEVLSWFGKLGVVTPAGDSIFLVEAL